MGLAQASYADVCENRRTTCSAACDSQCTYVDCEVVVTNINPALLQSLPMDIPIPRPNCSNLAPNISVVRVDYVPFSLLELGLEWHSQAIPHPVVELRTPVCTPQVNVGPPCPTTTTTTVTVTTTTDTTTTTLGSGSTTTTDTTTTTSTVTTTTTQARTWQFRESDTHGQSDLVCGYPLCSSFAGQACNPPPAMRLCVTDLSIHNPGACCNTSAVCPGAYHSYSCE